VDFEHITVLLEETVDLLMTDPNGVYVDCTIGGTGHSKLLLSRLTSQAKLIGVDQDERAISHAREVFAGDNRVILVRENFRYLEKILIKLGVLPVQGIMFDLGVSSPQLDEAARGFSYMQDAWLDMRMDTSSGLTACEIVNTWEEKELERIIRQYGEERWAKRIAHFIVEARAKQAIERTGRLVEIIKAAIPASARREGPHPAKRTFQALRIVVNDELGVLEEALDQALRCLDSGGRIAVITFHSLEDRIVKNKMQLWLGKCTCPKDLPYCRCGAKELVRIVTRKPILPSDKEVKNNPRSRSAKLRIAEKK
jgi:16S rRNA (cytosine1402-N4)-methyltransferase